MSGSVFWVVHSKIPVEKARNKKPSQDAPVFCVVLSLLSPYPTFGSTVSTYKMLDRGRCFRIVANRTYTHKEEAWHD